jgi:DNA-binding LacI/PurR family transcriptional regulator
MAYFIFVLHVGRVYHRKKLSSGKRASEGIELHRRGKRSYTNGSGAETMSRSGELKYVRLANIIREDIEAGMYKIGEIIPSQQDIAKRFKVNRATVKLAENILEEEGYLQCIPSVGAVVRTISKQKTIVGYLVSSLKDPFHLEMIRELDTSLGHHNAAVMVGEGRSAKRLIDMGATKIVKAGQLWNTSSEDTVQTVYVGYANPGLNCVTVNNEKGMRLLHNYIRSLGHERISYLSTSIEAIDEFDIRFKTLMEICPKKTAAYIKENSFFVENYSEKELKGVLQDIMGRRNRPTALICSSDWLAIEIIEYAEQLKISIPSDISIAGFDNIFISNRINVPLTTVSFPLNKAAEAIAKILFTSGNSKPVQAVIEPELIIRKSAGPVSG